MKRIVWLMLLAMLAIPVAALAQADFSQVIALTPTKYGESIGALGKASIEVNPKGIEIFTICAVADVANRTVFTVQVSRKQETFEVGAVRMLLGMGTFEQWSTVDPSPVFPLGEIRHVTVYQGKNAVLEGTF